jgi:hypothetical protein
VSRYLDAETQHVRFSIWNEDGVAVAALSLDADEARRLRAFLGLEPVKRRPDFLRRIRSYS